MKKIGILLVVVLALTLVSCSSSRGVTSSEQAAKVADNIAKREYRIDVTRAMPTGGRTVFLTGNYSLEVKGDSVFSYLPYYGRAYSVPYGGGDGLIFKAAISDYQANTNRKDRTSINFRARTNEDMFNFDVMVWSDGNATVGVTSVNRQKISFDGSMVTQPRVVN